MTMNLRASIGFPLDSALPRDVVSINPVFNGDDAEGLANALATNIKAHAGFAATTPFTIKVYNADKGPPNFPLAIVTNGSGFTTSSVPRELALCLSYFTTWNRPTYRGRLYFPAHFVTSTLQVRPTQAARDAVISMKSLFTSGMPSGTVWVVYSKVQKKSQGAVTDVWCDDEWDVMRSRGLRGTTRSTGTVP
jgi:hypothetical protein